MAHSIVVLILQNASGWLHPQNVWAVCILKSKGKKPAFNPEIFTEHLTELGPEKVPRSWCLVPSLHGK